MIILTLRTDKPESELGLFNDEVQLRYETWEAHRILAETLHLKLDELLRTQKLAFSDIQGIVVYEGPGSFTGLRIGLSAANALAYSLKVPIVATTGEDWVQVGITQLRAGKNDNVALPEYGAPVHITKQKH
jgi:tRNA threonylcarbamoyladenosine biosynthesis protein TsaB